MKPKCCTDPWMWGDFPEEKKYKKVSQEASIQATIEHIQKSLLGS